MDKIHKNLDFLIEVLAKAVKIKPTLPSPKGPKTLPMPSVDMPKLPGAPTTDIKAVSNAPQAKKNPLKIAEQINNPDAKKLAMKQAKELLKVSKNGQWSLSKYSSIDD
jgi:hypothetical protein